MIVRIQKKVAEFMELKRGEAVFIKPEGKRRLVIEVEYGTGGQETRCPQSNPAIAEF